MSRAIDVMHLGRDRVICAYEVDGLVVDPGPSTCVERLLEGLEGPPRGLLLTHIHLDHAGAAGVLARRFPELVVYVHEAGAPHLVDPSKLLRSAERLYRDDMELLWGEVAPVPERNIRTLSGGERVEGFRVAHTPGHAVHHVCYLNEASGEAYVGDMAGVRIPPHRHTLVPTPPPDIDVEAWVDSLHTIASWNPQVLCLAHFGPTSEVEDQLHAVRVGIVKEDERARRGEEEFVRATEDDLRAAVGDELPQYEQAAPLDQLYMGLERYWRKRAEREAAGGAVA